MTDKKLPLAEDLTVPDLKAALDKKGVDYPSNAHRDELVDLAAEHGVVQTDDEPEQKSNVSQLKPDTKTDTKAEEKKAEEKKPEPKSTQTRGPNPTDPSGDPAPVGPHPSAPTADFALTAQTGQFHPEDQSILANIAAPAATAVQAEESVTATLAAAAHVDPDAEVEESAASVKARETDADRVEALRAVEPEFDLKAHKAETERNEAVMEAAHAAHTDALAEAEKADAERAKKAEAEAKKADSKSAEKK